MTAKLYEGTKRLFAKSMKRGEYNQYRGWENPANENPSDEGYLVEYVDGGKANDSRHVGYISWSPKDVFERSYKPVADAMHQMTFGKALEAIKMGERVSRAGWNGKGMFVYMVPPASYPAQTGAATAHFGEGAMVPYNAYMAIKNVNGTVSTWVPSVNDCLADDWKVVGDKEEGGLPPHQQRVVAEKAELDDRLAKLDAFILDNPLYLKLDEAEQQRLKRQSLYMGQYSDVLGERIKAFVQAVEQGA